MDSAIVPDLGGWAAAAWLAAAVGSTISTRAPPSTRVPLAALPAVIGQVGTWSAVPAVLPDADLERAFAAAVAPEAHGYVASAVALLIVGARSVELDRPMTNAAAGGALGIVAAVALGAWLGGASWPLALLALTSVAALGVGASGAAGPAALAALLGWLGARHVALFADHVAGGSAVHGVMVAGPGVLLATALSAGWSRDRAPRAGTFAALVVVALLGAANTARLGPLRQAVAASSADGGVQP